MTIWISNPFVNMGVIRTTEMFFGRTNLLRRFYNAIANHQSVSLVGPRCIGKSSLLWYASQPEVQAQFPLDLQHHLFVPLDLREFRTRESDVFFQNVTREILLQSRKCPDLSLQVEGRGEDAFSNILDQVNEQGYFPVLLLDAFDTVTRNEHFGPEFFSFLRAHATKTSFVTATIAPLYHLCHEGIVDSPFFNIFHEYIIDALAPGEARDLISVPAQKVGMPFGEDDIEEIIHLAGYHPFFIQRVCYVVMEEKIQRGSGEIDWRQMKQMAYKDLLPYFQDTWKRLSEAQRAVLQDEAQQKGKEKREIPELSESAFFRQFIRNICQVGVFTMSPEELQAALDEIDDLKTLGETNLRLMKTVTRRLADNPAASTVERGIVIREILTQAFERMRGPGIRSDGNQAWQLYNILHYRFFKHHMKNEQISARLEFTSIRQYYRYRNKAIESLLNILFEMESANVSGE